MSVYYECKRTRLIETFLCKRKCNVLSSVPSNTIPESQCPLYTLSYEVGSPLSRQSSLASSPNSPGFDMSTSDSELPSSNMKVIVGLFFPLVIRYFCRAIPPSPPFVFGSLRKWSATCAFSASARVVGHSWVSHRSVKELASASIDLPPNCKLTRKDPFLELWHCVRHIGYAIKCETRITFGNTTAMIIAGAPMGKGFV